MPTTQHYSSEKELQKYIAQTVPKEALAFDFTFVRREMMIFPMIPDVMFVGFKELPIGKMFSEKWTYLQAYIIRHVRMNPCITYDNLQAETFISAFDGYITPLLKKGILVRLDGDKIDLSDALKNIEVEIVAVEAKIKDWRQALRQAVSYKPYADKVVVVMDPNFVPKQEHWAEFEAQKVGLSTLRDGVYQWFVKPTTDCPTDHSKEYIYFSAGFKRQNKWVLMNHKQGE